MASEERPTLGLREMAALTDSFWEADRIAKSIARLREQQAGITTQPAYATRWSQFEVSPRRTAPILAFIGAAAEQRGYSQNEAHTITDKLRIVLNQLDAHPGETIAVHSRQVQTCGSSTEPRAVQETIVESIMPQTRLVRVGAGTLTIPVTSSLYVRGTPEMAKSSGPKPPKLILSDVLNHTINGELDKTKSSDTVLYIGTEAVLGFMERVGLATTPVEMPDHAPNLPTGMLGRQENDVRTA